MRPSQWKHSLSIARNSSVYFQPKLTPIILLLLKLIKSLEQDTGFLAWKMGSCATGLILNNDELLDRSCRRVSL